MVKLAILFVHFGVALQITLTEAVYHDETDGKHYDDYCKIHKRKHDAEELAELAGVAVHGLQDAVEENVHEALEVH